MDVGTFLVELVARVIDKPNKWYYIRILDDLNLQLGLQTEHKEKCIYGSDLLCNLYYY